MARGELSHPEEHAEAPLNPPITEALPASFTASEPESRAAVPDFNLTSDYIEVFGSDFRPGTGKLIDNWWTRYIFSGGMLDYLNDEWQRYRESGNHVRSNRGISLTALRHNGHYWPSGMLRSKTCFPIGDGNDWYFETRGKVPRGLGVWPAVWLAADQRPADLGNWDRMPAWPPEIDIMEVVNNGREDTLNQLHTNAHVRDWQNNPQQIRFIAAIEGFNRDFNWWWAPFNFADDYHVFSLHYKRPICTWYCDRKFIFRVNYEWVNDDRQPSGPAHLLLNLAIGGNWAGRHGVDANAFPQSFDIDYTRVYNRQAPLQRSVIGHDLLQEPDEGGGGNLGPSDAEVRHAMQEALTNLSALSPGSHNDPRLVKAMNDAVAALNSGLN